MLHKATIAGLTMDPDNNAPIIVLAVDGVPQPLPIWIGLLEATSIASALKNVRFDRPMTHDLFKNFAETLNISLSQVEISDIIDHTYYARMQFISSDGSFSMDARPSDAIALALRFDAPIYVSDLVIEKSGGMKTPPEMEDQSEEGKRWAEYLERLDPEDFGKYKL